MQCDRCAEIGAYGLVDEFGDSLGHPAEFYVLLASMDCDKIVEQKMCLQHMEEYTDAIKSGDEYIYDYCVPGHRLHDFEVRSIDDAAVTTLIAQLKKMSELIASQSVSTKDMSVAMNRISERINRLQAELDRNASG